MFGKNPVMKRDQGNGWRLKVVSIWPTIQGEGPYAGTPAIFIRLHGCNLRCWFCDTEFSNPADPIYTVEFIIAHVGDIMKEHPGIRTVVLTGGEPVRQTLDKLIMGLLNAYPISVHIETAGTLWQDVLRNPRVKVVVSPKTPSVHPNIAEVAAAYKYIISHGEIDPRDGLPGTSTQLKGKIEHIARPPASLPLNQIFLSPCDEYNDERNALNRKIVVDMAMRFGYRAGVQLHKILKVD